VNDILNQINRGRIVIICISYIIYVSYEFEIYIYFIIIEEEHAGGAGFFILFITWYISAIQQSGNLAMLSTLPLTSLLLSSGYFINILLLLLNNFK